MTLSPELNLNPKFETPSVTPSLPSGAPTPDDTNTCAVCVCIYIHVCVRTRVCTRIRVSVHQLLLRLTFANQPARAQAPPCPPPRDRTHPPALAASIEMIPSPRPRTHLGEKKYEKNEMIPSPRPRTHLSLPRSITMIKVSPGSEGWLSGADQKVRARRG